MRKFSSQLLELSSDYWQLESEAWVKQRKLEWKQIRLSLESLGSLNRNEIIALRDFYLEKKLLPSDLKFREYGYFFYLIPCDSSEKFSKIFKFLLKNKKDVYGFFMTSIAYDLPNSDWYLREFYSKGLQIELLENERGVEGTLLWATTFVKSFEKSALYFLTSYISTDRCGIEKAVDYWIDCSCYMEKYGNKQESREHLLPLLDIVINFYEPRGFVERESFARILSNEIKLKLSESVASTVIELNWKRINCDGGYSVPRKLLPDYLEVRESNIGNRDNMLITLSNSIFDINITELMNGLLHVLFQLGFIDHPAFKKKGWFDIGQNIDNERKCYFGISSDDKVPVYKLEIPLNQKFSALLNEQANMHIEILWFLQGEKHVEKIEKKHQLKGVLSLGYGDYYRDYSSSPSIILKWWHICKEFERETGTPFYCEKWDYWGSQKHNLEFYKPSLEYESIFDIERFEEGLIVDQLNSIILDEYTGMGLPEPEI